MIIHMIKDATKEELGSTSSVKVMLDPRSIIYLGFYLFHNHFNLLPALPGFLNKIQYCCGQPVIAIINPIAGFESVFDTSEEKQLFFIYLFLKLRGDISCNSVNSSLALDGIDMALAGNKIPQTQSYSIKANRLPEEFNLTDAAIEAFLELIPLLNRAMLIKLLIESDKVVELLKLIFPISMSEKIVCTTRILEVIKK